MQFHVSFFDMHWRPNAQNLELSTKVRENTINLSGIRAETRSLHVGNRQSCCLVTTQMTRLDMIDIRFNVKFKALFGNMALVYETMVLHGLGQNPQKMKPQLVWQPKSGFRNHDLRGSKLIKTMVFKTLV